MNHKILRLRRLFALLRATSLRMTSFGLFFPRFGAYNDQRIMSHEIEAKFPVKDHARVRRRLRACGAVFLGTYVQTDRFYDTPGGGYRQTGCGLRLRCLNILRSGEKKLDARPQITFKGPVQANTKVKIRREIQTRLDCAQTAHQLLLACGLQQVACYRKRRGSYRLDGCLVELDQVPKLGSFVEIEGPGEKAVEALRRRLGITSDHIPASYLQLLDEKGVLTNAPADKDFGDHL
jgi:adenylate cyclase class 2